MNYGLNTRRFVMNLVCVVLLLGIYQTYTFGGTAPVERTGQTTSYAAGDDGALKKGVVWPKPRFKDNKNGTVTDRLTKLVWLKNANAFGTQYWDKALTAANTLASGSKGLTDGSKAGDWRLPNIKELQSLIDFAFQSPALSDESGIHRWTEGHPFNGVARNDYFSSTTPVYATMYAFSVDMESGLTLFSNKTPSAYVWPVRDEK